MQYIWTIIHNNPPPPAYTVMSDVQEETGGVSDELCLLPVKLRPLTGTVGTELCLRRRRFSRVTPQRSMVSCPHQHAVIIIIFIHQDVFLVQILKKPHTVTVKSELKAMTGEQMLVECSAHNPPPAASEAALDDLCWIPFGIQSQSVGPEGGKLCLEPSAGAMGEKERDTILLEVPPGAVSPSESVEVRSALMPDGPFTLPKGYQLGSMIVYLYYDGAISASPLHSLSRTGMVGRTRSEMACPLQWLFTH